MQSTSAKDKRGDIAQHKYPIHLIHHGRQKHIASRNNKITVYPYDDDLEGEEKAQNNFLYYSTDTLKGSSGSPVFGSTMTMPTRPPNRPPNPAPWPVVIW